MNRDHYYSWRTVGSLLKTLPSPLRPRTSVPATVTARVLCTPYAMRQTVLAALGSSRPRWWPIRVETAWLRPYLPY